jgi:hypothetical protein
MSKKLAKTLKKKIQPVRELFFILSAVFLGWAFFHSQTSEQRVLLLAETALVCAILSETYAIDRHD